VPKRRVTDRLAQDRAAGQDAIYGRPDPAPPAAAGPAPPPAEDGLEQQEPTWEETHHRVATYWPLELLEAVEAEMRRSRRSKSRVVVDALREHLALPLDLLAAIQAERWRSGRSKTQVIEDALRAHLTPPPPAGQ
jgi:Ribbon-helix-helix protein, copG family